MPIFENETTRLEEIPLVGREKELGHLKKQLETVDNGEGARVVLISGEAGIGKTRLAREAIRFAKERGFKVLEGKCLHESLTPYLPIFEALREGELGHLVSFEKPPRIENIFLMTTAGVPLIRLEREVAGLDMDIFSGMLSAVSTFVKESMKNLTKGKAKDTSLDVMGYGDHRILLETGQFCSLVIILTGQETEILNDDMRYTLDKIEKIHEHILRGWNGEESKAEPIKAMLEPFLDIYDGVDYVTDPKNKQWRLFENVSKGLKRIMKVQPVLLFLDDLQWSDASSLALLHTVVMSCIKDRLFVLGTYRPEGLENTDGKEHPLMSFRRAMWKEENISDLKLECLKDQTTECLLAYTIGEFAHKALGKLIIKESEGNPFFALELVTFLKLDGTVILVDGEWKLTRPLAKIGLPERVRDAVIARINQISQEQKDILECAAVVGEVFRSDTVGCVLETNRLHLLKALHDIERRHRLICELSGQNKFKFEHTIIREVLYSELPNELKIEYHKTIINCLKKAYDEGMKEVQSDLAIHMSLVNHPETVDFCIRSGDAARFEFNIDEAKRFYSMALERCQDAGRSNILDKLGETEYQAGDFDKAKSMYSAAMETAKDNSEKIELTLKVAKTSERIGELQNALEIIDKVPIEKKVSLIYARWLAVRAWLLYRFGKLEESITTSETALDMFKSSQGTHDDIIDVINTIASCYRYRSDFNKSVDYYNQGLTIAEENGNWFQVKRLTYNLSVTYGENGQLEKAMQFAKKSISVAEKIRDQSSENMGKIGLCYILYLIGKYSEAEIILDETIEKIRGMNIPYWLSAGLYQRALCRLEMGKFESALEDCKESMDIAKDIGGTILLISQSDMLELYVKCGKIKDAEMLAIKLIEAARSSDLKTIVFEGQRNLAMSLALQDRREEAENLFATMEKDNAELRNTFDYAKFLRCWAEAYTRWNELDKAHDKFEEARKSFKKMGAAGELAKVKKALREIEEKNQK